MTAVILAAGRGGRLRGVVGNRPKGLAVLGNRTLLARQIQALRGCGIDRIAVVAGYRADDVRHECGPAVEVVVNSRFASTNSLYSLWLARDLLRDGFVVLNCDVLFHPQLLADLLSARYEDALLMCPAGVDAKFSQEEMKVRVRRGLVAAIDKRMPARWVDGENVGIAKFGPQGAELLVERMSAIVRGGDRRHWLPRAFAEFAAQRPLHVVGTRGYPWIEIDFPEDYWRALKDILPAIDADARRHSPAPAAGSAAAEARRTLRHV
jgi:choline kinase